MYTPSKRGQLDPDRRRATPDRYCRSPRRFQYDRRTDSNHFYQDRHSSSRADHGSRRSSRYRRRDDLELVLEDSNSDSEIDEGGIRPRKDDIIDSRYKILSIAGKGTFATVLICKDLKHRDVVAVKVVRSIERYLDATEAELDALEHLQRHPRHSESYCVRLYKSFTANYRRQEHVFIVFETLGKSLYQFMKENRVSPFSNRDIKSMARQLLIAISFCHANQIIHTDLKLENILFKDDAVISSLEDGRKCNRLRRNEIRVIDFGGATFYRDRHSSIINTRQYRGPEVILGLEWSYPSDLWSAGCIIAEIVTGKLLFATHDNLEHLALMEKVLGKRIPSEMVNNALEQSVPSRSRSRSVSGRSPSKATPQKLVERGRGLMWPDRAKSERSIEHVRNQSPLSDLIIDPQLCNLLRGLLEIDPRLRLTAQEALRHEYFR